jgi:hypothetical protein
MTNYLELIPDAAKVGTAVAAPALSLFGVAVEEWTFVLSGIVSLLFILEKLPSVIRKLIEAYSWLRQYVKRKKS